MTHDVSNMTSTEVEQLIFGDAHPAELVAMPPELAEEIVVHGTHLSRSLRDWAWNTFSASFFEED